jgi:hypothetical protein
MCATDGIASALKPDRRAAAESSRGRVVANPLTGDFEAVLQVGGGTIDRLLATMHQNHGVDPDRPTFPHSVALRIGDHGAVGGVRGSVWAQTSTPRVELIHGATDRFEIEIGVRARYRADAGTTPLAEFINGSVRAVYRLATVDPNCIGWAGIASDYIWPRVESDSISFDGTAVDGGLLGQLERVLDSQAIDERITRQFAALLLTQFAAAPQKVGRSFRVGSMRSLNIGGSSAVVIPVGMAGGPPLGRLDSADQILLDGNDMALAVSREYIMSVVQASLDDLRSRFYHEIEVRTEIDVGLFDVEALDIHYGVRLTNATADWAATQVSGSSAAVITVRVSGAALTSRSIFNIDFDVEQQILLTFDVGNEGIALSALGPPSVGTSGILGGFAHDAIRDEVSNEVRNLLGQLAGGLGMRGRTAELVDQLRLLDARADAHFENANFSQDGVVFGGRISLSGRRPPAATFVKANDQDGFSAYQSWIPGGRVDRYEWSWTWANAAATPGAYTAADRFVLLRESAGGRTNFGRMVGVEAPLPGLDGSGRVCLNVRGMQVDSVSGALVAVESGPQCQRFGFVVALHPGEGMGRLLLREYEDAPVNSPGPPRESGLVEVGGRVSDRPGTNTLVVHSTRMWERETTSSLMSGLSAASRRDAGLLVLALFPDGVLETWDADGWGRMRELAVELPAQLLLGEDINGRWSAALQLTSEPAGPAWRLVSPNGGVTWTHDGVLEPQQLASALDAFLFPSDFVGITRNSGGIERGSRVSAGALNPYFGHVTEPHCPPIPLGRGVGSVIVAFAQRDSVTSKLLVEQIRREHAASGDAADFVAVVVDGAGVDAIPEEERVVVIADSIGVIADRFDVHHWPTTVRINDRGVVTDVQHGVRNDDPKEAT